MSVKNCNLFKYITKKNIVILGIFIINKDVKRKSIKIKVAGKIYKPRYLFKKSNYFLMIKEIINSIPNDLKDKVIVLPHPLINEYLKENELNKYLIETPIYDKILKQTKLLITDYSSIACDAFYRGTNVIFWWKEKDECMEQYSGHLCLNENNVFGDICYNKEQLKKVVEKNYNEKQPEEYIKNYMKIVEFNDGNNTKRIIEKMKQDKIL